MKKEIIEHAAKLGYDPLWSKVADSIEAALRQEGEQIIKRKVTSASILEHLKKVAPGPRSELSADEEQKRDELRKRIAAQAKVVGFEQLPAKAIDAIEVALRPDFDGLVESRVTAAMIAEHYKKVHQALTQRPAAAPKPASTSQDAVVAKPSAKQAAKATRVASAAST